MYEIFEKLLKEKGITAYRVSKETGIPTSSLTDWKKKRSKPKFENIKKIADYLGVSIEYLLGETETKVLKPETREHMVRMPLYAQICCGNGGFVDDDIIDYISLPDTILNPHKEYFAQYAKGDSMDGANIHNGDLLVFEKTNILENSQIGCFCVDNNDAMCKKFYKTDSGIIMLQPANDKYDPIAVTVENQCFRILGKLAIVINKR
ncbi:helix-turn-helix domain-containing protein [[Clostridium] innocuum]|nr:helix-turn-helix domain-containing protein [[Clostridium] innocuum]